MLHKIVMMERGAVAYVPQGRKSIKEVVNSIPLFSLQEIDGKALLLLTREMIMSYMGLKLGPAIKLLCFVEELKTKKSS